MSLRSYHGSSIDPNTPFLAPTITMRPGQTVRISLANNLYEMKDGKRLPTEKCKTPEGGVNVPHCFNETSLHAHGLWVSPAGNSDNVLISINPGVTFDYEYNVPSDHTAGTFWYHPHKHGSTALQVSSGMVGALIIKDDRAPTATTPGDIDVLLQDAQGRGLPRQGADVPAGAVRLLRRRRVRSRRRPDRPASPGSARPARPARFATTPSS